MQPYSYWEMVEAVPPKLTIYTSLDGLSDYLQNLS